MEIRELKRIIVVGGGISGLAAVHRLLELRREKAADMDILLLEARRRLGGVIATERIGDFLVEAGPDSFISEKPSAIRLCERLGITTRLISTNAAHQTLYVVHKGCLKPLPEGFVLLAPTRFWPFIRTPLFSWPGKLRLWLEPFVPRGKNSDESLASFVRRRFGQEILERVAQPLIGGIYAADPETLSLRATMPRFLEMERTSGSVIRAMRREQQSNRKGSGARWSLFVSMIGGMEEFVEALASHLPGSTTRRGAAVQSLAWNANRKNWMVAVEGGEMLKAHGVILALPSYASAQILSPVAPELARELDSVPYSSAATVSLGYRQEHVPCELDGFGFVVPAIEKRRIIACTFSSVKYSGRAPANHFLLRAFVGGALHRELFEQDDATMANAVREELDALLGIKAAPSFCRIYRHPRSMPQYQLGHLELIRRVEVKLADFPTLALAGNAYHGVGIADCIHSGEEAAEKLFRFMAAA